MTLKPTSRYPLSLNSASSVADSSSDADRAAIRSHNDETDAQREIVRVVRALGWAFADGSPEYAILRQHKTLSV